MTLLICELILLVAIHMDVGPTNIFLQTKKKPRSKAFACELTEWARLNGWPVGRKSYACASATHVHTARGQYDVVI